MVIYEIRNAALGMVAIGSIKERTMTVIHTSGGLPHGRSWQVSDFESDFGGPKYGNWVRVDSPITIQFNPEQ